MELITEPNVHLVAKTAVDWEMVARFLEEEGVPPIPESIRAGADESAAVIELSARMCYMSYGKGRKDIEDFVTNLLSKGDGSVFEHVNYGFIITGVSRSLTHELVRHRAGFAFSQRSQRFVDEKEAAFVVPPALTDEREATDKGLEILKDSLDRASESYQVLVAELDKALPESDFPTWSDRRKAIRQAARAVLPNATETKIFVTANVRAWRHFIEMRGAAYADWEIRKLALKILSILQEEAPLLFSDFVVEDLPDQTQIATSRYTKV